LAEGCGRQGNAIGNFKVGDKRGAFGADAPFIYLVIAVLLVGVFIADQQVPLGVAVWVLYMVPVAATFFVSRPDAPVYTAAGTTVMMIIGYHLSPPGGSAEVAQINRAFGIASVWLVAAAAFFYVRSRVRLERVNWMQDVHAEVAQQMLGEKSVTGTAGDALRVLSQRLGAAVSAAYLVDGAVLTRVATWGVQDEGDVPRTIGPNEGLIGQVLSDQRAVVLKGVSASYLRVRSALGGEPPRTVLVAPITADGRANGALELGLLGRREDEIDDVLELLDRMASSVGMALRTAQYRERLQELLEETQRQGELLQAQQEELRVSNEELEEQSKVLRESQTRLENQQAELEQTNVQLEEQTQRLERQKHDLLIAQSALERNAEEIQRSSRYKSEFLANMSHELRTPLNSSMILSRLLAENRAGNLLPEQIRYAQIILSANNDLLNLINDVLDLSKIEAGHLQLDPQPVSIAQLLEPVREAFLPVADQKGLALRFEVTPDAPAAIVTDAMRLQQVLRNLLSNALKFTEHGEVVLTAHNGQSETVSFTVRDTGIGISEEQQKVIFEAFRQADGTTSRKYGGTGLGLSICRELAALLGGSIDVVSRPGEGSAFTLRLPLKTPAPGAEVAAPVSAPAPAQALVPAVKSSRAAPAPSAVAPRAVDAARAPESRQRTILVVEDDVAFSEILCKVVEEQGFKCLVARTAQEGLEIARSGSPSAILLDIGLPDLSGLAVLEKLKRAAATRHIPTHVVSVNDYSQTALQMGAVGYVLKPTAREEIVAAIGRLEHRMERRVQRVLVIEDDGALRQSIVELLRSEGVELEAVGTVRDALDRLHSATFDCVVLDLTLPDGTGYEVLEGMAEGEQYAFPPVIVYTGRSLTRDEEQRLRRYSRSIILKGARSPERLLDEVTLFLHMVEGELPPERQRMLKEARERDAVLEGRTLLLVEDDVRNIFSLSRIFEPLGSKVEIARNGREALNALDGNNGIDLVLMDIMMPEMDGLTAMREIRKRPGMAALPIIALTANAMPEDRARCLEAGANDYISKPIDIDKLVSLCRVWMPK
jgi:signal transduction histidine kinase/CheY-like chemotaxis protein